VGPGRGAFTAYVRRSHAERFNVNQAPDDNVRSLTTNGTLGANLDWRWSRPLGRGTFSLRAGADASGNRVHIQLFEESPTDPADRSLTTDVRSPSWDVAGYALGDYRIGRVTLSGGVRWDYIRVPFEDQLDPAADTTNSFRRLSPRGGLSVELGTGASALVGDFRDPRKRPAPADRCCPPFAPKTIRRRPVITTAAAQLIAPFYVTAWSTAPTCGTTSRSSSRRPPEAFDNIAARGSRRSRLQVLV
jgi:hypothetical protein